MVFKLFLIVCLVGVATSQSLPDLSLYDLVLNLVKCDCNLRDDMDVSETKVHYFNFESNSNATYNISEALEKIVARTDFNSTQHYFLYFIGFNTDMDSKPTKDMLCSFGGYEIEGKRPVGMVFDYSHYAQGIGLEKINVVAVYLKAVKYLLSLATVLGKFTCDFLEFVPKEFVIAIGHSLGAHVLGKAAEICKALQNKTLKCIYGADPAGPCFKDSNCRSYHIQKTQADRTVILHYNAGELGTDLNLADINVYFGDGRTQKGCTGTNPLNVTLRALASTCSHSNAPGIIGESLIRDVWEATKCGSYQSFSNGSCANNEKIKVELDKVPVGSEGIYYVETDTIRRCNN